MAKLERSELLKLAQLTSLTLADDEIESLRDDLERLLSYTDELMAVDLGREEQTVRNTNLFRDDTVHQEKRAIIEQAPERAEQYFVVPKIVDDSKDAS